MAFVFPELQSFLTILDKAVDFCMEHEMKDAAVSEIQRSIYENVYQQYTPRVYDRKYDQGGLLDPDHMASNYDRMTKTLTVEDMRVDWEPTKQSHFGRNVAEVVETGNGYDWKQIGPRPFHEPAERELANGVADEVLTKSLEQNLGAWSL